jgi:opacity protein-like surface antigen
VRRVRGAAAETSMKRLLAAVTGVLCVGAFAPPPVAADVLLTPFAGVTFADNADVRKFNYGASLAFGGLIGFEFDVSQTRLGTFDDIPIVDLEADATTMMANLMIRVPAGPVQPYASGGVGLIRVRGEVEVPFVGSLVSASASDLGMNVGGGIHLFPSPNIGIRGDVRYFRTIGDLDLSDFDDIDGLNDLPLPRIDFWRVTGGVTIRF